MEELQVIETTSGRQFKPWASREDVQAIKQETVQAVGQAVQDPASITAITSEIASGKQAIASAINAKGGTASAAENFAQLAEAVETIPNYSDMVKLAGIIAGGNYGKNALQGHNENVKYGKTEIVDSVGAFEKINVDYCFQYWDLLEKVTMPNLKSIGQYAFYGSSVKEVIFDECTSIGNNAFMECSQLSKAIFPNCISVTGTVFRGCSSLNVINILHLNNDIGTSYLLYDDKNLIDIIFGAGLTGNTSIYSYGFTLGGDTYSAASTTLCFDTDLENYGRNFANNNEKWNWCLREHFAANLQDRTGLSAYTLTFGSVYLSAMEAETIQAFTNKNWTLA